MVLFRTIFRTIFTREKAIRFGYKNCVICSEYGYPFKLIPYQGKSDGRKGGPLIPKVVKEFLDEMAKGDRGFMSVK